MAKLKLKQKEWFTLADAAKYLTDTVQDQTITEADIIQFISTGHLAAAIHFSEKKLVTRDTMEFATDHRRLSCEEMRELNFYQDYDRLRSGSPLRPSLRFLKGAPGAGNMTLGDEYSISGLWDVNGSFIGNPIISKMLHRAIQGHTITPEVISEIISELSDKDKQMHPINLLKLDMIGGDTEPDSPRWEVSIPLESLAEGSIVCVRSLALKELFEDEPKPQATGLSTKEKKTYLKIIRTLCENHKHLDLGQHSTAAGQIIAMADTMGLTIPSKRTLETLLKEARDLED
ncbi:hypothetical protein [Marinobacter sp. bablab_jr008]|uniref:hypothetical protein n=1 Tax=Marinobacter sp. bablab_jr008 TaxID=2755064 RepID=UPI0018F15AF7|nr:hypothetical protein [Marinobacter sp. bablab_jr008]MEC9388072.1 hypothetical protein [Pseudomonadota bacterium]